MNYWLIKSEPNEYSWEDLTKEGSTLWTGIRNYQARKYILNMKVKDEILFYHTGKEKKVVGICEVLREAEVETNTNNKWYAVTIKPVKMLENPVSLSKIKQLSYFNSHPIIKQPRLSVMPLSKDDFFKILELSKSK